jgi:hypothetical protein
MLAVAVLLAPGKAEAALQRGPNNLSLLGYWSFDEGNGLQAGDSSGNRNTGVLTNGAAWTKGKRGNAVVLDGSNDYVAIDPGTNLDITDNTYTISLWYRKGAADEQGQLLRKGEGGDNGYGIVIGPAVDGAACVDNQINFFRFNVTSYCLGSVPADTQWHHIAIVQSPSGLVSYVDGILNGSNGNTGAPLTSPGIFALGEGKNAVSNWFGSIDEVRVYDRALSAQEINNLYRIGGTPRRTISNQGLLAYLPMDEATSTSVGDVSGNNRNGTLIGGAEWMNGKRGGAVRVGSLSDGRIESVLNGTNLATTSVAFWVRPNSVPGTQRGLFQWADTLGATMPFILLSYEPGSVSRLYVEGGYQISTTLPVSTWSHIGITVGSNVWIFYVNGVEVGRYTDPSPPRTHVANALNIYMGNGFGGFSQASFDDFRAYDRELSSEEIRTLATQVDFLRLNSTPTRTVTSGLVGYWPFDGRFMNWTANQALDASVSGNSGLLNNMSTTSSPTIGKIGQALNFDGSNDFIDAGSPANLDDLGSMSVCAWINISTNPTGYPGIVSKSSGGLAGWQFYLYDSGGGSAGLGFYNTDGSAVERATTVPFGSWQHVCGTWNGNPADGLLGKKLYLNGTELGSTVLNPYGGGTPDATYSLQIGSLGGGSFLHNGAIDDVRVYDRELTAAEVRRIFNVGQ